MLTTKEALKLLREFSGISLSIHRRKDLYILKKKLGDTLSKEIYKGNNKQVASYIINMAKPIYKGV